MALKSQAKSLKQLFSYDSERAQIVNDRAIRGLADAAGATKSKVIQGAIEESVLPRTRYIRALAERYYTGESSMPGVMSDFFRTVGDDVARGRNRFNCKPIVERVSEYLINFNSRTGVEIETTHGLLWPQEVMSLYRSDWERFERAASTYESIADLLTKVDNAPANPNVYLPASEESFAARFLLDLDEVCREWADVNAMKTYAKENLQIAINSGQDTLAVPLSADYIIANSLDADQAKHAVVIEVRNSGSLAIPHFVFLTEKPANELDRAELDRFDRACALICPDYAVALKQRVALKKADDGTYSNLEEHLAAPEPGYFGVLDSSRFDSELGLNSDVRIIRGGA